MPVCGVGARRAAVVMRRLQSCVVWRCPGNAMATSVTATRCFAQHQASSSVSMRAASLKGKRWRCGLHCARWPFPTALDGYSRPRPLPGATALRQTPLQVSESELADGKRTRGRANTRSD